MRTLLARAEQNRSADRMRIVVRSEHILEIQDTGVRAFDYDLCI